MTYTWTDNAMQGGASCDVDKANDNLMHLKYDNASPQDGKVPYSVNFAHRNVSGDADIINKVSDTEVSFNIDGGTSYSPLVVTYPDGTSETTTNQSNIDSGMDSDGTYYFIKEKNSAVTAILATISEQSVAPTSPSSGDYWIDIGVRPYMPYKYDGSNWIETQFVKLGEAKKTGTLDLPISYDLNQDWGTRISMPDYSSGVTKSVNTVYQADSDGFVYIQGTQGYSRNGYLYVGSTSNPGNIVWRHYTGSATDSISSGFIPIPKKTYYKASGHVSSFVWYPNLKR